EILEGEVLGEKYTPRPAIPKPGEAVATPRVNRDVNSIRAEVGSVDKTLAGREDTAPIATNIIQAADKKAQWIATTERRFAQIVQGLGKEDRIKVGELLDKYENPIFAFPMDPLAAKAQLLRTEFN